MRTLVALLVSLFLVTLAGAQQCAHSTNQTCTLAPYNIQLQDQTFCPRNDAVASSLQRNGTGCSDLNYCCQSLNSFSSAAASAAVRVIGLFQSIDQNSNALVVPTGQQVQLEFLREACVGSISFTGGVPSLDVTVYQFQPSGNISSQQVSLTSASSSLNLCHVAALGISVPSSTDPDITAASIQSMNLCLLGADVDTCGVCNGKGVCQTGAPAAASLQDANVPPPINARLSQQQINSGDNAVGASWASSTSVRRAIQPTLVCNTRLPSSDMCFAVFGYQFVDYDPTLDSSAPVYVSSSNNFFLPDPGYRGQPCVFTAPGSNASFGVLWDCTTHHHTKLSWTIISQSTEFGGLVDRTVVAGRELNTCSDYYLSWL